MRKLLPAILVILLLCIGGGDLRAFEIPQVSARAAVLLDAATGRVLFSKNAHERLPMASTTKIMTAVAALENGRLDDVVKVSENAAAVEGSSVDLEAGEEKTLEELLYALILRSGNDAATAIAEHISGSVEEFAKLMTRRAAELGALDTNFVNPHGLHHEDHYTTAYDLAVIMAHAMTLPKFREISGTREIKISWPGKPYDRLLRNQNRLLDIYEGADGGKTGWTTPAGRCFVGTATRDGWQLVAVVLNAPDMWDDAVKLLDFGYGYYRFETVVEAGQPLISAGVEKGAREKVSLLAARDLKLPLKEDEKDYLRYEFNLPEKLVAPLRAGEEAGQVLVFFGEQQVGTVPLVAGEEVEKRGILYFLRNLISRLRFK